MELPEDAQRAPSPPPIEPRKPPTTPAELEAFLLGPEQGLARALAGRVNPGYHRSGSTYVSSTKKDYDDPAARNEPVEPVDKQHFHSLDDVGKHGAWRARGARSRPRGSALTRRWPAAAAQPRQRCATRRCSRVRRPRSRECTRRRAGACNAILWG